MYCPQHVASNQGNLELNHQRWCSLSFPETFFEVVCLSELLCNATVTLQGALCEPIIVGSSFFSYSVLQLKSLLSLRRL